MNILRESRIAALIKESLLRIYSACAESAFLKLVLTLLSWFSYSSVYGAVNLILEKISFLFKGSVVYKLLYKKSSEREYTDNSAVFRLVDKLTGFFVRFFSKAYSYIGRVNSGSLNNRLYIAVREGFSLSYENILGIIMIVIVTVPGSMWKNTYGLILALVSAVLFLLCVFSRKDYSLNLRGFGMPMLVFVFSVMLAVLISESRADSIRVLMFFVTSFIFMAAIGSSMNTEDKLQKFLGFIYAGVIITSLVCILQSAVGLETDLLTVDTETSGDISRAFSTFENPNNFAEYLVLFMPFMAAFALNKESRKEKSLYLSLLILPLAALVLTYSRSCWVTFAIAAVLFILLYDYKLFPYVLAAAVIVIPFLPESVLNRIFTIGSMEDTSNYYRVQIWTGSLKMLKDRWLTGIGLGPAAFGKVYSEYSVFAASDAMHSHMLFLEIFIETGIMGALSFVIWWLTTIKGFLTALIRNKLKDRKIRNIIIAAVSSLAAFTFVSGVEYVWFYPRVMIMFFAAAGIMLAAMSILRKE